MAMIETGPWIIASTHTLKKYQGRFTLSVDDLDEMAVSLRDGLTVMNQQHDPLRPSTMTVISAEIEPDADGENSVLKVNFLVDENEWAAFISGLKERGAPGGFSYARSVPFAQNRDGQATVVIAADAEFFTQEEIAEAAGLYRANDHEIVELAELVQFSSADVCQIVVVMQQPPTSTLQTWGPAVVGGLIGPVLIGLAKAGTFIRYRLKLRDLESVGDRLEAIVETADREVIEEAVAGLDQLEDSWRNGEDSQLWAFDESNCLWVPRKHN
jgi:hypothetical protein